MEKEKKNVPWTGHYIGDKTLFSAVAFANTMIHEVEPIKDAIGKASYHYKIPYSAVALELMVADYIKESDKGWTEV